MADIYVTPGGLDANPGTIASPKKTPAGAHAATSAGDTVHYHGGTYYILGENDLDVDGNAGNVITHKPYISGGVTETVIFSGLSGTFGATDALISIAGDF